MCQVTSWAFIIFEYYLQVIQFFLFGNNNIMFFYGVVTKVLLWSSLRELEAHAMESNNLYPGNKDKVDKQEDGELPAT